MQPVFGLLEDDSTWIPHHIAGYFVTIVYRHVVHYFAIDVFDQRVIYLIWIHPLQLTFFLFLVDGVVEKLHIYPCICIHEIRILHSSFWVSGFLNKF